MTRNRGVVVTNRYLHDAALAAVRLSRPPRRPGSASEDSHD